jgi:LysM repeat protein
MAEDDYITVYIRAWKKWGVPEEEIDITFDAISLTGPAVGHPAPAPTATATPMPTSAVTVLPTATPMATATPAAVTECKATNLVHNGDFEHGFATLTYGHVGTSWGHFVNGGRAAYGFYDEQWPPVVASGSHGQLIEINTKGLAAADGDRYAGIYQTVTGLTKGATYELTVKGMLRGAGGGPDANRFEAQWGWNAGSNADWSHATWTSMDLGRIYDRTSPGSMGTYTVRFTAPDTTLTLFLRGWMKWGFTETEMDLNFDDISLRGCSTTVVHPTPAPAPSHPVACTYTVKPGDYLGKIAAHYGVTVASLASANGIWNYDHVYVGQMLSIPGCTTGGTAYHAPSPAPAHHPAPPPAPVHHRTHTVQPGESLSWIAAWYGVNMYDLARANGISNLNHVWVGQVLVVP